MADRRDAYVSRVSYAAIISLGEENKRADAHDVINEDVMREQALLAEHMKYLADKHNVTAKICDAIDMYNISTNAFQRMTGLGPKIYELIKKRNHRVWDIRVLISVIAGLGTKINALEACEWLSDCGYHEYSYRYFIYYYLVKNYYGRPYHEWCDFCIRHNLPMLGARDSKGKDRM